MKRRIIALLLISVCLSSFFSTTAFAETYAPSETDLSISLDESMWYVFTRDNLADNPELDELGVSHDLIHDFLYDNNAYMDAILFYEDGQYIEFYIRKSTEDPEIVNLSNYKDKEVLALAEALADRQGIDTYSTYESQYKFARLDYFDSNYSYYLCEFVTVVNRVSYTFTFQAPAQFAEPEYEEIERVMDSISFNVDPSMKETSSFKLDYSSVAISGAVGALIGGIWGLIISLRKKKARREQ